MTTGIKIPLQVTGGAAGEQDLKKVERGYRGVAAAQDAAAKSARNLRREQAGAVPGAGAADRAAMARRASAAIGVASFGGGLVGGAGGFIGRGAGAGFRAGGGTTGALAAGIGLGAIAAVGKTLVAGITDFDERMAEVVRKAYAIRGKLDEASKATGQAGVATVGGDGLGIQRALTAGFSLEEIKAARTRGLSPEALAQAGRGGVDTAVAAQRFGVSPDQAAAAIAKNGLGKGDAFTNAAKIASELQGRRVGKEEIARARAGSTFGGQMDQVIAYQGRTSNVGVDAVTGGRATAAAIDSFNKANSPLAYAIGEEFRKAMDECEVMNKLAENQGILAKIIGNLTSGGSREVQAIRFANDSAATLNLVGAGN